MTLFNHLPPSAAREFKQRLDAETRGCARSTALLRGLMSFGRGVAFRVDSPDLEDIQAQLADAFAGSLTLRDQQRWQHHVTVQNKVDPAAATG